MRKITIGRASDNTIVFSSPTISGHHADVLVFDDGRVVYTDHSSNGTWVNGSRLHNESYEIRENDRIILPGNVLLDWSMLHIRTPKTHFETYNSNSGGVKQGYSHQYAGQNSNYPTRTLSFGEAISNVFSHYADFHGRARRSEYWWFALLNNILYNTVYAMALIMPNAVETMVLLVMSFLYSLVVFIPGLAVSVRRLHDIGKSGWNLLFGLIPLVGYILLIVWYAQDSEPGANKYGISPKYPNKGKGY